MTAIAIVMATALLLAVAAVATIEAGLGAERAASGSEAAASLPMVGRLRVVLAALAANSGERRRVLSLALAAVVFALVAAALWHSSEPAAAFVDWLEAALPAWLSWMV